MPRKVKPATARIRNDRNYAQGVYVGETFLQADPGFELDVPIEVALRVKDHGWTVIGATFETQVEEAD